MTSVADPARSEALLLQQSRGLTCPNTLAERTLPRYVFPFTDWDEAKTTSGCYKNARALAVSQSVSGALMWVPGASTQHNTVAKAVKVPIHPYAASQSDFANRQLCLVPIVVRGSKRHWIGERPHPHADLALHLLLLRLLHFVSISFLTARRWINCCYFIFCMLYSSTLFTGVFVR